MLTVPDLAELLAVPQRTIYQWRMKGYGPRGIRVGKHVRYRRCDVDAWLDQQSEPRPAA